jgi:hypothetical protein
MTNVFQILTRSLRITQKMLIMHLWLQSTPTT